MSFIKVINEISQILLNSSDPSFAIKKSLELVGHALEVDCALIDRNVLNEETNRLFVETQFNWYRDDRVLRLDTIDMSNFSYEDVFEVFAGTLGVGKPLYRNSMSDLKLKSEIGETLREYKVKSFFIAPISFNSSHWGNLAFFDYSKERDWLEIEEELMIVCRLISSSIKNLELRKSFGEELSSSHSVKMATLGEMASGIAHEINNPLFVINGYASRIDSTIERGLLDMDELSNISKKIQRNCKRVTSIISGLRMMSRKTKLDELEVKNFIEIIESTIDFSYERIRLANIELINNMSSTDEALIECHPEQISQVIVNLLNNSYDSLASSNEEKWIELNIKELEDRVIFSLTDSGRRISNEVAKKVMQPFYTTKDSGKGTGLGLSISKEIIVKHGGNFYLDEHCENMRFVIELPKLSYE